MIKSNINIIFFIEFFEKIKQNKISENFKLKLKENTFRVINEVYKTRLILNQKLQHVKKECLKIIK